MTATVNITTQQRIGTLLIPTSALTFATTFAANNRLVVAAVATAVAAVVAAVAAVGLRQWQWHRQRHR